MKKRLQQWLDSYRRPNRIVIDKQAKLHNAGRLQHTTVQISGASYMTVAANTLVIDTNILIEGDQNEINIGAECVLDGDFMNKTNGIWG